MELVEDQLDLPVFTASFFPNNEDGTLEFGYIDQTLYTGNLISAPVNNETDGSWTVDNIVMTVKDVKVTQSMLFGIIPHSEHELHLHLFFSSKFSF